MASKQILVLLLAAVLCISNVMSQPCKKEDFPYLRQNKPTVGILRIRYFLFGDDSLSQEELEIADLSKQEPTAGRDKVPTSTPGEQMRRPDEKDSQPILKRPIDQKESIPSQPEGQQKPNPRVQEKIPVNPVNQSMVDPSKTDVPLPDESMNKLEQQKIKDLDPNLSAGYQSQKNEPNPENMDPKDQLLGQLIQEKVLQQQQSQPQRQPQQQPLASQRRRRSQPVPRQLLPDYDDSFPHYGPGTGDVHIYDDTHLYYDDPTRFQRPKTNADLSIQNDRSPYYQPQRNDGVVDVELNMRK